MKYLGIELCSPMDENSRVTLRWRVLQKKSAMQWLSLLVNLVQERNRFFPRFTGFVSPYKTPEHISQRLNTAIEIINREGLYSIPERASGEFDQTFANIIHHHFELLRGNADTPSEYFNKASPLARVAILNLNHCIHDLESLDKGHKDKDRLASALILEAMRPVRHQMPAEYFSEFDLHNDYGDVVLHYAQIGKTWWEVFLDQDEDIHEEAIAPLSVISGEFDIFFQPHHLTLPKWRELRSFLIDQNQDPADLSLRLGYLTVARFINDLNLAPSAYNQLISEHMQLRSIQVSENGNEICRLKLDGDCFDIYQCIDRPEIIPLHPLDPQYMEIHS